MLNRDYDVVVVGGGLAGTFAAIAAAREGARVGLVEQYGFLGGMATAAPVSVFMQYHVAGADGTDHELVRGLFEETVNRLHAADAMLDTPFSFDDVLLRGILDDLAGEAGVEVLFHALLHDVVTVDGRLNSARCAVKGGEVNLSASVFVDSTGDGDLAALAGAPFRVGRESDGRSQPLTPTFCLGGVDPARLPGGGDRRAVLRETNRILREAHGRGECAVRGVGFWPMPQHGLYFFNTSHIWIDDPLDPFAFSRAERRGRERVRDILQALRRHVPGFESAYVARSGVQIGVRESRHLRGRYTLTRDDVVGGRAFDDGIARCAYEIDIHPLVEGENTDHVVLDRGVYYEIPYRCLVPAAGAENVLVACRALSADHAAHGSLRIMPTMAAVGEAAGIAAVRATASENCVAAVGGASLKRDLLERRILGDPPAALTGVKDAGENEEPK